MKTSNNKENIVKIIYGNENLKEILSNLLENIFIEELKKVQF